MPYKFETDKLKIHKKLEPEEYELYSTYTEE